MRSIVLELAPLMFVGGASPWLRSTFHPTVSPKGKCKPRPGPTYDSYQRLIPRPALAINAEAEMKQVRQNSRSVGGLLAAGKIKSKLKE